MELALSSYMAIVIPTLPEVVRGASKKTTGRFHVGLLQVLTIASLKNFLTNKCNDAQTSRNIIPAKEYIAERIDQNS